MWSFGNLARTHHHPRHHHFMGYRGGNYAGMNYAEPMSAEKKNMMIDAGLYKGAAVVTASIVGGISAYKGLPEIKNLAGADVLLGLALSGLEFYMIYKGGLGKEGSKAIAMIGGASTGLLCHWAAVQGTIWGATKARAEGASGGPTVAGWDNSHYGEADPASQAELPPKRNVPAPSRAPAFDTNYGMM